MTRDTASPGASINGFQPDEGFARQCDAEDPLREYRDRFCIPRRDDGSEVIYLAGNSLGLEPKGVRAALEQELSDWANKGVDAHFRGKTPWYSYHQVFRESGARLVGALPGEVVMMNSLTVNLHLMMVTFYQPNPQRYKVFMDDPAFPSDTYAVKTHLRYRGYDPADALILARPRGEEHTIREDDLVALLDQRSQEIALVFLSGVNFFTGQAFDMARIAATAHRRGCLVGLDLAHAAGNIPLHLHDWNIDFAVWCNYKYLNSGPGAVGGCFIHERHARNVDLARFGGWWGNDPDTRFLMHLQPDFVPRGDADGWQISNPPILAMAPMKVSIDLFDEVGMAALRSKSMRLTGYLQYLIDRISPDRFEVITPREPAARGCQLSMLVHDRPKELLKALQGKGVVCDFREPDIIRVAPVPLYNTFHEVWRFARVLAGHARSC